MSMFILDPFRLAAPGAPPGDWGTVTPLAAETPSAFLILSRSGFATINGTKDIDWDAVTASSGWTFTPTAATLTVPADGYVVCSLNAFRFGSVGSLAGGQVELLKNGTAVAFRGMSSQFWLPNTMRVALYCESGDTLKWTVTLGSVKTDWELRSSYEVY